MIPIRSYRAPQAPAIYARGEPYNQASPHVTAAYLMANTLPPMTQPIPTRRKRASKPKVKTGCKTCKIRHVKCDEKKPACLRCTTTGRKCDGYEAPAQTGSGTVADEPLPVLHPGDNTRLIQLPHSMSLAFDGSVQERQTFDRFRFLTVPALAGGSELEFWQSLVLRAGQSEPLVRNAVIALGTLHEDYQSRGGRYDANLILEPGYQRALHLYIKGLGQLQALIATTGGTSPKLALIAGILFTCFETLRRNNMGAILHYTAGLRELKRQMHLRQTPDGLDMLPNRERSNQPVVRQMPEDELDLMLKVYARYDIQACTFAKPRAEPLATQLPTLPPSSLNLHEVKHHLDSLLITAYQLVGSEHVMYRYWERDRIPRDWELHIGAALTTFRGWNDRLRDFFNASESNLKPAELKSLLGLRLQIKVAMILLEVSKDDGLECNFDRFRGDFEDMVSSVERVTQSLGLMDADPLDKESTPFTMELGIVYPLFFVAQKCRESRLRRRAIAQLRKAGKEGVWEGPIMAILAKRIMQVEEQGLISGQRVPERQRIHKVQHDVHYDTRQVNFQMTLSQDKSWRNWEVIREIVHF